MMIIQHYFSVITVYFNTAVQTEDTPDLRFPMTVIMYFGCNFLGDELLRLFVAIIST